MRAAILHAADVPAVGVSRFIGADADLDDNPLLRQTPVAGARQHGIRID